ncbi:hypothetical protein D8B26_005360 [Coccidioides posadasii str. Silveira]|uniref:Uncharacterized protein n=1 Tax=Coccidioides posadasii (strain RMSCC 757 / Silveira) TaxID=443226 RepID=E9D521_COCPS|nr:conserved hypothetical protein [Coccidioides posadasii str. Silveira]QVM10707.1 hypothetical protein D8B26_005360 [Coccidioides posadasii str. Silveira]
MVFLEVALMASRQMYRLTESVQVRERFEAFKVADINDKHYEPVTGVLMKRRMTDAMITIGLQFIQQSITADTIPGHEAIDLLRPLDRIVAEATSIMETQSLKELLQVLPKLISNITVPKGRQELMIRESLQWLSDLYPGWTFCAENGTGAKVQITNLCSEPVMEESMQEKLVWLAKMYFGWTFRMIDERLQVPGEKSLKLWCTHDIKSDRRRGENEYLYPVY